jgi:hypothetical protein
MTDGTAPRYAIPEVAQRSIGLNPTMRMEMLGFQLFSNPFSF